MRDRDGMVWEHYISRGNDSTLSGVRDNRVEVIVFFSQAQKKSSQIFRPTFPPKKNRREFHDFSAPQAIFLGIWEAIFDFP